MRCERSQVIMTSPTSNRLRKVHGMDQVDVHSMTCVSYHAVHRMTSPCTLRHRNSLRKWCTAWTKGYGDEQLLTLT